MALVDACFRTGTIYIDMHCHRADLTCRIQPHRTQTEAQIATWHAALRFQNRRDARNCISWNDQGASTRSYHRRSERRTLGIDHKATCGL